MQRKVQYLNPEPALMTAEDIARDAQISLSKAYDFLSILEAQGRTVRFGRSHRILRSEWEAYIRKSPPAPLLIFPENKKAPAPVATGTGTKQNIQSKYSTTARNGQGGHNAE